MHLSELNIYPIKSMKGIALDEAKVEGRGLQHDRRWMLIDSNNRFISQRENGGLALISVAVEEQGLRVSLDGQSSLMIPFSWDESEVVSVQIWNDVCNSAPVSKEADQWFSEALKQECRLVYMPDQMTRPVAKEFAVNSDVVSFADGYPFLLISEASLTDLNSRLSETLPMNRFRPNFVVNGATPFAEDAWQAVSIGDTSFHVVKPCARCVMTTIDQRTGVRGGPEPLKTMATFRELDNKVLFGQNLIAARTGQIVRVGDPVEPTLN